MIDNKLLLTVEDHFLIKGRGLVVIPLLEHPPNNRQFISFSCDALIIRPDQTECRFTLKFAVEHFSLVGGGSKWNITPIFPDGTKEIIPISSQIFVSAAVLAKLNGEETNERVE